MTATVVSSSGANGGGITAHVSTSRVVVPTVVAYVSGEYLTIPW